MINPYSIPPFVSSLIIISFGIFVFIKNRYGLINRVFLFFTATLFGWLFFEAILFSIKNEKTAIVVSKLEYIGVTAIPIASFLLSLAILRRKASNFFYVFSSIWYLISMFLIFRTNLILGGINKFYWGYYGRASNFHIFYLIIWLSIYIRAMYLLYRNGIRNKYRTYSLEERNKMRYIFLIFIFGTIGILDFLPKYGIGLYPLGYMFIPIMCAVVTHAILKHQLMDINIVIKKGVIYSVLAGIITAGYFIFVLIVGSLFQGLVGYRSFFVNLFAIFTIAILFNPLRNRIQHFLDKRFFRGTLESLSKERERLQQELFNAEKLARAGMIASSAVHEIKNPLTAIKTFTEYASEKIQDSEFKDRFTRLVPKEIERVEKVVHQLLELAKPRQPLFKEIKLHYIIDSTLALLENNLKSNKVELKKDYQSKEIAIPADEEQLCQVFLNLFLNAIDAMSDGGTLTVETSISGNSSLKLVVISVKDTGKGIPPETLDKLFTPFFTTKKEGTGLGLIITQEIIKQHKGTIDVESTIGKGTTFIIRFPIVGKN